MLDASEDNPFGDNETDTFGSTWLNSSKDDETGGFGGDQSGDHGGYDVATVTGNAPETTPAAASAIDISGSQTGDLDDESKEFSNDGSFGDDADGFGDGKAVEFDDEKAFETGDENANVAADGDFDFGIDDQTGGFDLDSIEDEDSASLGDSGFVPATSSRSKTPAASMQQPTIADIGGSQTVPGSESSVGDAAKSSRGPPTAGAQQSSAESDDGFGSWDVAADAVGALDSHAEHPTTGSQTCSESDTIGFGDGSNLDFDPGEFSFDSADRDVVGVEFGACFGAGQSEETEGGAEL